MAYLYAGNNEQRAYLRRIVFGGEADERWLGPRWKWLVRRVFGRSGRDDADLEFEQLRDMNGAARAAKHGIVMPEWVWGEMVFDDVEPSSRAMRDHRRQVRKWGYGCEVTSDPGAIEQFIREMVIPYYERRYGEEALGCQAEERPWGDSQVELVLVTRENVAVAGTLIAYGAAGPVQWRVGVLAGKPELVRQGAIQAAYYFQHEHLQRRGMTRVEAGSTKPFFADGVLAYKKNWGLRMTEPWGAPFLLRLRRTTEPVRSFLLNNPFVMLDDGKLAAAVFLPRDTPPPVEELEPLARFLWPGIDHVVAFYFEAPARRSDLAPASSAERIVVRRVPVSTPARRTH